MTPVRLAIMAPTLNLANYLFGIDQGYFRREGLDIEVIVRPGLRNVQAVLDGEADFGVANECVIQKALDGPTPLRIVLQVLEDPLHDLLVRPGIDRLADLKGKRIGVPGAGSTPEIQTRVLFRRADIDVMVVPQPRDQTMEDRIRTFEAGGYDGLIVSPPYSLVLRDRGYRALTELSGEFPHAASHGLVATTSTLKTRRDVVDAMVRGYSAGVRALKNDRAAALAFISRRFKLDGDLAARSYDLLKDRWTAALSLDALQVECEFQAAARGVAAVRARDVTDTRFAP